MAKNSTLADLDAFLKEQETSKNITKKTDTSFTKEEFVNQNPHQIIETEILAQADKTVKKEDIEEAMKNHILESSELIGLYKRS